MGAVGFFAGAVVADEGGDGADAELGGVLLLGGGGVGEVDGEDGEFAVELAADVALGESVGVEGLAGGAPTGGEDDDGGPVGVAAFGDGAVPGGIEAIGGECGGGME